MPKTKIKSYEDLLKFAVGSTYNADDAAISKEELDERVQERYKANGETNTYRINDINNGYAWGLSGYCSRIINSMNRLDQAIENETDPVQKAMGMAVRRFAFPELERIIEDDIFDMAKSSRDDIYSNFDVSKDAADKFDKRIEQAEKNISGDRDKLWYADINKLHYADIPAAEQLNTLDLLMKAFTDKKAFTNVDGIREVNQNQPMTDVLEQVNKNAKEILGKMKGEKGANFKPSTEAEKNDFEALKAQYEKMSAAEKASYEDAIAGFTKIENYADMDITPKIKSANLIFDKHPVVDLTAESFVQKQSRNELSPTETEWGETNIDRMVQSLYTDDELDALRKAGIDPAMGILVDGKGVDWQPNTTNSTNFHENTVRQNADIKCGIAAKAMEGAQLDVCKFVPDGKGGYKSGPVVPVKTDLSMKTQRRSLWTMLKQLFGFTVTLKDKVKQANDAEREYQVNPDNAKIPAAAKRNAEVIAMRNKFSEQNKLSSAMDLDFFESVYPTDNPKADKHDAISSGIRKDAIFTTFDNNQGEIVKTVGRESSRVNLAILYGMANGHSYDEMTADTPEAKNLRRQTGKAFVEEFKVMSYDEFTKSKNLEANDESRKQYNSFVLGKMQNLERICVYGYDAMCKEQMPKLDPSNHAEFTDKFMKMHHLGKMAMDFSQSYEPLARNKIAPTDPAAARITDRAGAFYDYTSGKLQPFIRLQSALETYAKYMSSTDYVEPSNKFDPRYAANAGKSKAMLSYFNSKSGDISKIGDFLDNGELGASICSMGYAVTMDTPGFNDSIGLEHAKYYLPSENPDFSIVGIDDKNKVIYDCGHKQSYGEIYSAISAGMNGFTAKAERYEKMLSAEQKELPFVDRYEAINDKMSQRAAEKKAIREAAAINEEISFADLFEEKEQPVSMPKNKGTEKPLSMGGKGM